MSKHSTAKFLIFSLVFSFIISNVPTSNAQNGPYKYINNIISFNAAEINEFDRQITLHIKNKDFKSALNLLHQLYPELPNNSNIPYLMGVCYFNLKDADNTLKYSKIALGIKPNDRDINALLGMQLYLTADYESALPCLQKTAQYKSNEAIYLLYLAKTYDALKNFPKAIEYYQKVYKLNPADVDILNNISISAFLMNDTNKAIEYSGKCLSLQPSNASCNYFMGNYIISIDPDKAIYHLEKSIELDNSFSNSANKMIDIAENFKNKLARNELNQMAQKSSSLKVMLQSPDLNALQDASPLYTGAINTYTESGKALAQEHKIIANEIFADIDIMTTKFAKTRELNQQFTNNEAKQLEIFQKLSAAKKIKQIFIKHESTIFEQTLEYQIQENYYWAIIDSIQSELNKYKLTNTQSLSDSIVVTNFYTRLLNAYIDLFEFYKSKYQTFLAFAVFNHAVEENPKYALPKDIIVKIKPYHSKELEISKQLIYNLEDNFNQIKTISKSTDSLNAFYNKMDVESMQEVENTITKLEAIKANNNNTNNEINVSSDLDAYIELYKSVKNQLKDKITEYKIKKAAIDNIKNSNSDYLAYTGNGFSQFYYSSIGSFASDLVQDMYSKASFIAKTGLKTTKLLAGTLLAEADYATGFAAEKIYNASSKIQMLQNYGNDYKKYASAYDKLGEKIYVVSLEDTLINPIQATLAGNDSKGVGQAAVSKFKESNDEFKEKVIGKGFVSNLLANLVTVGSYGLAEDFITLNDSGASTLDKIIAGTGVVLSFIPAFNASKTVNESGKASINTLRSSVNQTKNEITKLVIKKETAQTTSKVINLKILETMEEMLNKPELTKQLSSKINMLLSKQEVLKETIKEADKELVETSLKSIVKVPAETIKSGVRTVFETAFADHTPTAIAARINELFTAPLTQVIKNSDNFFGKTLASTVGLKDTANFLTSVVLNNTLGDGIKLISNSLALTNTEIKKEQIEKDKQSAVKQNKIASKIASTKEQQQNKNTSVKEPQSATPEQTFVSVAGTKDIIPSNVLALAKQNAANKHSSFGVGLGEFVSGIPENLLDEAYKMSLKGNKNISFDKLFNQNLALLMQKNGIQAKNVAIITTAPQQPAKASSKINTEKKDFKVDIGEILRKIMPEVQKKINEDSAKFSIQLRSQPTK